ncbi:MAG TPA: hypothetical protein VKA34_03165 [Balneolales bacterium]|nr:hypothetical protein [Balneolales bacterium]
MKIDFSEEITLTKWGLLQLILIFLAIGAGATLLNNLLGFLFVGVTVLVFAFPILNKVFGEKKDAPT